MSGGKSNPKKRGGYKHTNGTRKVTKVNDESRKAIERQVIHKPVKEEDEINPRWALFIAEYLVDFDGMRAAIAAGYDKKGASVRAHNLLKTPIIQRIIKRFREEDLLRVELTREEVLSQLLYCVTRSGEDFVDEDGRILSNIRDLPRRVLNSIDGIEQTVTVTPEGDERVRTKLKLVPKAEALNMAMKHIGLYAPEQKNVVVSAGLDFNKLVREDVPQDTIEAELGEANDTIQDSNKPSKNQGATSPGSELPKDSG